MKPYSFFDKDAFKDYAKRIIRTKNFNVACKLAKEIYDEGAENEYLK